MKDKLKRGLCIILAITLFMSPSSSGTGTIVAEAASYNGVTYSTDYHQWRQSDPAWAGSPLGSQGTLGAWGCLLTSLAILMVKAGIENPNSFNPGVLRDRYENRGFISHSSTSVAADGNLSAVAYNKQNSPNFYQVSTSNYHPTPYNQIYNDINSHLSKGEYAIVCVNYGGHFVAVDYCKNGEVYIIDPARSGKTTLRAYDGGIEFGKFYQAVKKSAPAAKSKTIYGKQMNYPKSIRRGKAFSVKGSISSAYKLTSVTVAVYNTKGKLVTGKTFKPNSTSFDIKKQADKYVLFNKLKKGTYYYRIKAQNSVNVKGTLLNKKFKVY